MSVLPFHILWPGGNTTALVDTPCDRRMHAGIAQRIMQEHPHVEQVGFLEAPTIEGADTRLQMMGGEFCGNAVRCAGFLHARDQGKQTVRLETSGFSELLSVDAGADHAALHLPASFLNDVSKIDDGVLVDFHGIRHLVFEHPLSEQERVRLVERYNGANAALGIMTVQREGTNILLQPMVWVRDTNSIVTETGCGSGSIAAAFALQRHDPLTTQFNIRQPSGSVYGVRLDVATGELQSICLWGEMAVKPQGKVVLQNK